MNTIDMNNYLINKDVLILKTLNGISIIRLSGVNTIYFRRNAVEVRYKNGNTELYGLEDINYEALWNVLGKEIKNT